MADGSVETLHHKSILRKQRGLEGDTFSKCVREELLCSWSGFIYLCWFVTEVAEVGSVKSGDRMWTNFDFLTLSPENVDGVSIYIMLFLSSDLNKRSRQEKSMGTSAGGNAVRRVRCENADRRYHCVWELWNCFEYRWTVVGSRNCTKWKTYCQFLICCHLSQICWSRRLSAI